MSNVIQIRDKDGNALYPITDISCVIGMEEGSGIEAVLCWDGASTPVIADIPAGVSVTYGGATYTGTLAASSGTVGKIYMVATGVSNNYDRYMSFAGSPSYVWQNIGDTTIDLTTYAKQAEVDELEAKVDDLSTGKYYGYFAQEEDLPEADVDGFAYVGEGPTYTIYNLRGGVWTSSNITVNQSPIGNDEDIDQNEDGKLQFANRTYNAQQPNGMGYKILRKDATFAEQVVATNTIYEIRYHFDLNNGTVVIPEGCTLKFNGGTIDNGCLVGTHTKIDAGNTNIFGRNIALSQCAFFKKTGDLTESKTILPWIDVSAKRVECKEDTGHSWKLRTSGAVAFSNADGLGQFVQLSNEEYLDIETEMRLSNNPGSFKKINTGSTVAAVQFDGQETGNYLVVFNPIKEDDGTTFIVPHTDRFVFFNSNDAGDNPNDTVIAPGTEIDLTQTTVYVAYLGIAYFDLRPSTWEGNARLEWFVDDYTEDYNSVSSLVEQSRPLQNALDCPMNVISGINGVIRCDNPVYAMVSKTIDLGSRFDSTTSIGRASNDKFRSGFWLPCTVVACLTDINLFYVRSRVEIIGGLFTSVFSATHTKSIIVLDGSYSQSYSRIKTSILGKGYSTECGILVDYYEKDSGSVNSFSEYDCYVGNCRYSLRTKSARTTAYSNTHTVKLICNGYAEAVSVVNGLFGASKFSLVLQDMPIVPIADVDNYFHARIVSDRCTIEIVPWDWSTAKTSASVQKPYKAPFISGTNNVLVGLSGSYVNGLGVDNFKNPGLVGHDPYVIYGTGYNNQFNHPYLGGAFSYFVGKSDQLKSAGCYLSAFSVLSSSFDVDSYDESLHENTTDVEETVKTTGIYTLINLLNPSGYITATSLNANQFLEIGIESATGFNFDNSKLWDAVTLSFMENPWKKVKILVWKNGTTKSVVTKDISDGKVFQKTAFNGLSEITKICIRLYGNPSDGYGVGTAINNKQVVPQIMAFSRHLNDNFFASHYQAITFVPTTSRPTSGLFPGKMIFDRTLGKPIWVKSVNSSGVATWVDSTGTTV